MDVWSYMIIYNTSKAELKAMLGVSTLLPIYGEVGVRSLYHQFWCLISKIWRFKPHCFMVKTGRKLAIWKWQNHVLVMFKSLD
jgi:hypothetical protein